MVILYLVSKEAHIERNCQCSRVAALNRATFPIYTAIRRSNVSLIYQVQAKDLKRAIHLITALGHDGHLFGHVLPRLAMARCCLENGQARYGNSQASGHGQALQREWPRAVLGS